jgi:hypothetical protein
MSQLQKETLLHPELIAINQDSENVIVYGRVDQASSSTAQVWVKQLAQQEGKGHDFIVALYNNG